MSGLSKFRNIDKMVGCERRLNEHLRKTKASIRTVLGVGEGDMPYGHKKAYWSNKYYKLSTKKKCFISLICNQSNHIVQYMSIGRQRNDLRL